MICYGETASNLTLSLQVCRKRKNYVCISLVHLAQQSLPPSFSILKVAICSMTAIHNAKWMKSALRNGHSVGTTVVGCPGPIDGDVT